MVVSVVRRIARAGITVILIEHVMRFLVQLSTRVMIMHHGEKIIEGPPQGLARRPDRRRRLSGRGRFAAAAARYLDLRQGDMTADACELDSDLRGLRPSSRPARDLAVAGDGPTRRHHRPQRPRQDDAAAHAYPGWFVRPQAATSRLTGADITGRPYRRDRRGGNRPRAPGRHALPEMTVLENLQMGAYLGRPRHEWKSGSKRFTPCCPSCASAVSQMASTLSGGERRMVAIGRGLMSRRANLMLDEPSLGLARW